MKFSDIREQKRKSCQQSVILEEHTDTFTVVHAADGLGGICQL